MKRYHVITSKSNLSKLNHFALKKLNLHGDVVEFITDGKSLEKISGEMETETTDLTTSAFRSIVKKYLMTIIGALLIFAAIINQSLSIMKVEFTDEDTYNQEILVFLDKYFTKAGPFSYLNAKLTDINFDLRSEFYQYEWIGIRKQGSVLYLDIKKLTNPPVIEDKQPGSYYASADGIVKRYHIEKGVVVVQEEQYVKKGELLISGLITHLGNQVESVHADGYVIGEVLRYRDFTIPKKESFSVRTGKLEIIRKYKVFGLSLGKWVSGFEIYETETEPVRGLPGVFQYQDLYLYESKAVNNHYDQEEAVNYAKSMVVKEFRKNKISPFEKIIFNNLVRIEEDDDHYHIRLIVKSYMNIAEFRPYS
jgi:similar to stage IV sporulation protein